MRYFLANKMLKAFNILFASSPFKLRVLISEISFHYLTNTTFSLSLTKTTLSKEKYIKKSSLHTTFESFIFVISFFVTIILEFLLL